MSYATILPLIASAFILEGCEQRHTPVPQEQPGHVQAWQAPVYGSSSNDLLWWYLLTSNRHTYYYSSPTYVSNYSSIPFERAATPAAEPQTIQQLQSTGTPPQAQETVQPAQEPAIAHEDAMEAMAQEAAEIQAENHADEGAEAADVSSSTESSSSDSGSSGGDSGGGSE